MRYSIEIMDLIENGELQKASDQVEHMGVRFGSDPPEPFMSDLLRRHLRVLQERRAELTTIDTASVPPIPVAVSVDPPPADVPLLYGTPVDGDPATPTEVPSGPSREPKSGERRGDRSAVVGPAVVESPVLTEAVDDGENRLVVDTVGAILSFRRGRKALNAGERSKAYECFEEALQLDPNHGESLTELIRCHKEDGLDSYGRGHVSAAIKSWTRAIQLAPDDSETLRFLKRAKAVQDNL